MKHCTLYKIGGSLLDWPELPDQLQKLLSPEERAILVVGGGRAADVVREWDAIYQLGEATAHQLAMHSLTLTARLLTQLLPNSQLVSTQDQLQHCWQTGQRPILLIADWVAHFEAHSSIPLPHNWQTTSDSLALWLCHHLQIPRLVLVKSVPAGGGILQAAETGQIDANFAAIRQQLAIQNTAPEFAWCHLRSAGAISQRFS